MALAWLGYGPASVALILVVPWEVESSFSRTQGLAILVGWLVFRDGETGIQGWR